MQLLLDTHVLLWAIGDDGRLLKRVAEALEDPTNILYFSMASLWEAAIKIAKGKLRVPGQSVDYLLEQAESHEAAILPIAVAHVRRTQILPHHHGDPFDRMLIAQAQ